MDDVLSVGVDERFGDVARDGDRGVDGETLFGLEQRAQRVAVDERHRVVQDGAGIFRLDDRDDARMVEAAGEPDLALESLAVDADGEIGGEDFDDDAAVAIARRRRRRGPFRRRRARG